MVPFEYKPHSSLHALQWAVGMEIFLLCEDPWRLALSTDHPNGGSFLAYPSVIAHLMSRDLRAETMRGASAGGIARTDLPDISREFSLREVAIVTRAAPARILGLERKGHLGVGADADITVYDDVPDREAMFRHPRCVMHAGRVVFEKGEPREDSPGEILQGPARPTPAGDAALEAWFEAYGSYRLDQLDAVEAAP
jgi:formylmethanofuran dehydrogenase subunit A